MGRGKISPVQAIEEYISRVQEVHRSKRGVNELSYRTPLENLLTIIGGALEPQVSVTQELADDGAGRPDFGLFVTNSETPRAVVETKGPQQSVPHTADGKQVAKYWDRYRVVLVTNYRDFLLVAPDQDGQPRVEGRCSLAPDEESFFRAKPGTLAKDKADELSEFLVGVMRRDVPILRPRDLAEDLARHAREALRRLERRPIEDLAPLKDAMERSLGLHFAGKEGEHFFRSSLVQTLFYGLFSGWMLWRQKAHKEGSFNWREASEFLALPLIADLYEEIARPKRLQEYELREPIEWSTASLNNVDEAIFFRTFDSDHAITLFYEPFLQAFDPQLRKELGVWYTPPEIVKYMVGRVDQLLRSELGIKNGLADENVYVLDPAVGTGSYVVEVARRIHQTLTEQGHGALAANEVKKALTTRVFGFEILPAPYVVSHLQLGVLLRDMKTKLAKDQRCAVYLTNALTGWEPPKGAKQTLAFHFLQEEQEASSRVKRDVPILVMLGNPPYNRFAGVAEDEEADLIEPYKDGLYENWGVRKQLLDDLYIRFFRLAEKRIAEIGGRGVVSYISNYSWLEGLSHPVMRERITKAFDTIWIDNCNGDKYRTGKRTPDGRPDESMFTTDDQRIGIQIGTAIATFVCKGRRNDGAVAEVFRRDLWGTSKEKRKRLIESLDVIAPPYVRATPTARNRWTYALQSASTTGYADWPSIPQLFPVHYSGLNENRFNAFITVTRDVIEQRMQSYFDRSRSLDDLSEVVPGVDAKVADYDPAKTRVAMLASRQFDGARIVPLLYRPMDVWWTYWEGEHKLFNRPRPDFFDQVWPGNIFLAASQTARKGTMNEPVVTDVLGDLHVQDPWSQYFPLFVKHVEGLRVGLIDPNVTVAMLEQLAAISGVTLYEADGHTMGDAASRLASMVFYHCLAILWSPTYRKENDVTLRQDWPRVPMPADIDVLEASATLGRSVANLLLPSTPVDGVTTGNLRAELRNLAVPTKIGGGTIEEGGDTRVETNWGFRGQKNAVMCGKGRMTKHGSDAGDAVDIWINDQVFWSNIPNDVWTMTIGGYPVLKKWLSYREYKILGRPLNTDELFYFSQMVRRLKSLVVLGSTLDANYRACVVGSQITVV